MASQAGYVAAAPAPGPDQPPVDPGTPGTPADPDPSVPGGSLPMPIGLSGVATPCTGRCSDDYRVRLEWDWPSFDRYLVFRHTANRFSEASQIHGTAFASHEDKTVQNGRTYYYWLVGENNQGERSPPTAPIRLIIPSN